MGPSSAPVRIIHGTLLRSHNIALQILAVSQSLRVPMGCLWAGGTQRQEKTKLRGCHTLESPLFLFYLQAFQVMFNVTKRFLLRKEKKKSQC